MVIRENVDKIFSLGMFEDVMINRVGDAEQTFIQRVPGGWVMSTWNIQRGQTSSSVFIPLTEEGKINK